MLHGVQEPSYILNHLLCYSAISFTNSNFLSTWLAALYHCVLYLKINTDMHVPSPVKMLTVACQYVSYFVRWTDIWLFSLLNGLYVFVPCVVQMSHLLTAACQYVSYFIRWTNSWPLSFISHCNDKKSIVHVLHFKIALYTITPACFVYNSAQYRIASNFCIVKFS